MDKIALEKNSLWALSRNVNEWLWNQNDSHYIPSILVQYDGYTDSFTQISLLQTHTFHG